MRAVEQVLAVAVLVSATGCVVPLARARRPGGAAAAWALLTLAVVAAWFLHKAPYEGPAIITVTPTRGLTVVDMVVPPGLAVAFAVLWRSWRQR